jgi:hypothetical protein
MPGLDWLTARPLAHCGLHNTAAGVIENTASAFTAAIAGGYSIETDLQISADGEAMVHHDEALGRLTDGNGRLADMSAAEIKAVCFKASADRILTLGEMCDLVGAHDALLIEATHSIRSDCRFRFSDFHPAVDNLVVARMILVIHVFDMSMPTRDASAIPAVRPPSTGKATPVI